MMSVLCLSIALLWAAPSKNDSQIFDKQKLYQSLAQEDLHAIKGMGPEGYIELRRIMQADDRPMAERWSAIIALAKIGRQESIQDLLWTQKQNTWYLRSAGLLALSLVEEDRGEARAKKLMSRDPALLVRATALQVLSQSVNMDRSFLWKELYNPINFHHGKSLSLRESILKVLSANPQKSEAEKFSLLRKEKDQNVSALAEQVLNR